MRRLDWKTIEGIDTQEAERLNGPDFIRCPITGFACFGRNCKQAEKVWKGADVEHDAGGTRVTCDHYVWMCNADGACEEVTKPVDRVREILSEATDSMAGLTACLTDIYDALYDAYTLLADAGVSVSDNENTAYDKVCVAGNLLDKLIREIKSADEKGKDS